MGNTKIPNKRETRLVNQIERQVEEGEQIIGIYGNKGSEGEEVSCIGFVVWKPPKFE